MGVVELKERQTIAATRVCERSRAHRESAKRADTSQQRSREGRLSAQRKGGWWVLSLGGKPVRLGPLAESGGGVT